MWKVIPILMFCRIYAARGTVFEVQIPAVSDGSRCRIQLFVGNELHSAICTFYPEKFVAGTNCATWKGATHLGEGLKKFNDVFKRTSVLGKMLSSSEDYLEGDTRKFSMDVPKLDKEPKSQTCVDETRSVEFTITMGTKSPSITLCNRLAKFLTLLEPTKEQNN